MVKLMCMVGQGREEYGREFVCVGRRHVVGDGGAEVEERSRDIRGGGLGLIDE
jgi:hypothetical protein